MPRARKLYLRRPEPAESDVLRAVLKAVKLHPRVAWAERLNSGAGHLSHDDGKTSQFIRFGWLGAPDVLGQLIDGRVLAVEVKRPSGRVSEHQRAFLDLVSRYGGVALVARRIEDVWEAL